MSIKPDYFFIDRPRSLTAVTPFRLDTHAASTHSLMSSNPDAHISNSPASSFFAAAYPASVPHGSRRRSTEKLPFPYSDTHQYPISPLAHGITVITSTADSPSSNNLHHNPREHSAGFGSHNSHHPVGDGISTSESSSFYMPVQDTSEIPRPPSYHLIQLLGN